MSSRDPWMGTPHGHAMGAVVEVVFCGGGQGRVMNPGLGGLDRMGQTTHGRALASGVVGTSPRARTDGWWTMEWYYNVFLYIWIDLNRWYIRYTCMIQR